MRLRDEERSLSLGAACRRVVPLHYFVRLVGTGGPVVQTGAAIWRQDSTSLIIFYHYIIFYFLCTMIIYMYFIC